MADTPKDDKKEDKSGTSGFVRFLSLTNEAIGDGIYKGVAGLGAPISAIHWGLTRIPGLEKYKDQKPVGGYGWNLEKLKAGKEWFDAKTGVVPATPQTKTEQLYHDSVSAVTSVVAVPGAAAVAGAFSKPAGLVGALPKIPAGTAVPTTTAQDAAAAAARNTVQTATNTVQTAAPSADDVAARLLAAKNAGVAERAAATAGSTAPAASQTTTAVAQAAPAASQATSTAAAQAAPAASSAASQATPILNTTAEAAAPFKHVSWWKARNILNSKEPLATRINMLQGTDHAHLIDKVIARARATGGITEESNRLVQMHTRIDPLTKIKVQDLYEARHFSNGPLGGAMEGLKGRFAYVADYPGSAAWSATKATTKWGLTTKSGLAATTTLGTTAGLTAYAMSGDDEKPAGDSKPASGETSPATGNQTPATHTQQPAAGTQPSAQSGNGGTMANDKPPQEASAPAPATASSGDGAQADNSMDFGGLFSNFADKTGLSGIANSNFGRGVKGLLMHNPWARGIATFGAALMVWNMMSSRSSNSGMKILGLVLAFAAAYAVGAGLDSMKPGSSNTPAVAQQRPGEATPAATGGASGSFNPAATPQTPSTQAADASTPARTAPASPEQKPIPQTPGMG